MSTEEQIYAFSRVLEEDAAIVVFNNDTVEQSVRLHLPEQWSGLSATADLADQIQGQVQARVHNRVMEMVIPGRSAALFTPGR